MSQSVSKTVFKIIKLSKSRVYTTGGGVCACAGDGLEGPQLLPNKRPPLPGVRGWLLHRN